MEDIPTHHICKIILFVSSFAIFILKDCRYGRQKYSFAEWHHSVIAQWKVNVENTWMSVNWGNLTLVGYDAHREDGE